MVEHGEYFGDESFQPDLDKVSGALNITIPSGKCQTAGPATFVRYTCEMTFSELRIGDHFIWPIAGEVPDTLNINVKIAWSHGGGGFAIDLATRHDITEPGKEPAETPGWIDRNARVVKLNGIL
jgi:hypothetical protein